MAFSMGFSTACEGLGPFARYGYFFQGPWYFRYDWSLVKQDHGWKPLRLWNGFEDLFPIGVHQAFSGGGKYSGKTIFLFQERVAIWNWDTQSVESTSTFKDTFNFPPPFDAYIDVGLAGRGPSDGLLYAFLADGQYAAYDWSREEVVEVGNLIERPRFYLPSLPDMNAAFNGAVTRQNYAFFFHQDSYIRYNWITGTCEPDRVRPVTDMNITTPPSSGPWWEVIKEKLEVGAAEYPEVARLITSASLDDWFRSIGIDPTRLG